MAVNAAVPHPSLVVLYVVSALAAGLHGLLEHGAHGLGPGHGGERRRCRPPPP